MALKTLLENFSMNLEEIGLDGLVDKSTKISIKTAETVLLQKAMDLR